MEPEADDDVSHVSESLFAGAGGQSTSSSRTETDQPPHSSAAAPGMEPEYSDDEVSQSMEADDDTPQPLPGPGDQRGAGHGTFEPHTVHPFRPVSSLPALSVGSSESQRGQPGVWAAVGPVRATPNIAAASEQQKNAEQLRRAASVGDRTLVVHPRANSIPWTTMQQLRAQPDPSATGQRQTSAAATNPNLVSVAVAPIPRPTQNNPRRPDPGSRPVVDLVENAPKPEPQPKSESESESDAVVVKRAKQGGAGARRPTQRVSPPESQSPHAKGNPDTDPRKLKKRLDETQEAKLALKEKFEKLQKELLTLVEDKKKTLDYLQTNYKFSVADDTSMVKAVSMFAQREHRDTTIAVYNTLLAAEAGTLMPHKDFNESSPIVANLPAIMRPEPAKTLSSARVAAPRSSGAGVPRLVSADYKEEEDNMPLPIGGRSQMVEITLQTNGKYGPESKTLTLGYNDKIKNAQDVTLGDGNTLELFSKRLQDIGKKRARMVAENMASLLPDVFDKKAVDNRSNQGYAYIDNCIKEDKTAIEEQKRKATEVKAKHDAAEKTLKTQLEQTNAAKQAVDTMLVEFQKRNETMQAQLGSWQQEVEKATAAKQATDTQLQRLQQHFETQQTQMNKWREDLEQAGRQIQVNNELDNMRAGSLKKVYTDAQLPLPAGQLNTLDTLISGLPQAIQNSASRNDATGAAWRRAVDQFYMQLFGTKTEPSEEKIGENAPETVMNRALLRIDNALRSLQVGFGTAMINRNNNLQPREMLHPESLDHVKLGVEKQIANTLGVLLGQLGIAYPYLTQNEAVEIFKALRLLLGFPLDTPANINEFANRIKGIADRRTELETQNARLLQELATSNGLRANGDAALKEAQMQLQQTRAQLADVRHALEHANSRIQVQQPREYDMKDALPLEDKSRQELLATQLSLEASNNDIGTKNNIITRICATFKRAAEYYVGGMGNPVIANDFTVIPGILDNKDWLDQIDKTLSILVRVQAARSSDGPYTCVTTSLHDSVRNFITKDRILASGWYEVIEWKTLQDISPVAIAAAESPPPPPRKLPPPSGPSFQLPARPPPPGPWSGFPGGPTDLWNAVVCCYRLWQWSDQTSLGTVKPAQANEAFGAMFTAKDRATFTGTLRRVFAIIAEWKSYLEKSLAKGKRQEYTYFRPRVNGVEGGDVMTDPDALYDVGELSRKKTPLTIDALFSLPHAAIARVSNGLRFQNLKRSETLEISVFSQHQLVPREITKAIGESARDKQLPAMGPVDILLSPSIFKDVYPVCLSDLIVMENEEDKAFDDIIMADPKHYKASEYHHSILVIRFTRDNSGGVVLNRKADQWRIWYATMSYGLFLKHILHLQFLFRTASIDSGFRSRLSELLRSDDLMFESLLKLAQECVKNFVTFNAGKRVARDPATTLIDVSIPVENQRPKQSILYIERGKPPDFVATPFSSVQRRPRAATSTPHAFRPINDETQSQLDLFGGTEDDGDSKGYPLRDVSPLLQPSSHVLDFGDAVDNKHNSNESESQPAATPLGLVRSWNAGSDTRIHPSGTRQDAGLSRRRRAQQADPDPDLAPASEYDQPSLLGRLGGYLFG